MIYMTDTLKIKLLGPFRLNHWAIVFQSLQSFLLNAYVSEVSEVTQSSLTLCDPMDSSLHQAPLSMGFSRQEYWRELPFPSPGNLPDPRIEPRSPTF